MSPREAVRAKQSRFVREYAVDCNGAAAAVRAGYSPRSAKVTASRLLTKDNVQRALRQIQQVDAERLALSREAVIGQLQDAIEFARVKQDPMAMIVGLRELGRMMGYYGSSDI
ncbi:MAG TPA: terminase small subunit [Acidovorax temperans]|jgi:phage terminase small subunit|nr:terminase small subunit [Acidovorax temperans]